MEFIISKKYDIPEINERIMGPNPLKLQEELLFGHMIPEGSTVMDLGSGQGVTSLALAKDYGFMVYATDLWSDPSENMIFFRKMGLTEKQIVPIKADANDLPFAKDFFDAVVTTDSYNFFGRDVEFLPNKLLPFVKRGGYVYIVIPGFKTDCHDDLPPELLLSWTPEQLEYIHDMDYWSQMISAASEADIISINEAECDEEAWADWLKCDNEYARGDRKTIEAGGGKYLNFINIVLRRKENS